MPKRPLILTIFGWFLILAGAVGFVAHFPLHRAWHSDDAWPLGLELILMIAGVFILRGHNWARWLAVAWIAFHVGLSFYHSLREVAIHTLILLIFVWILFHHAANVWFKARSQKQPPPNPA
jgi:uncharacterized membrane protein HdeD (DUF308 family)